MLKAFGTMTVAVVSLSRQGAPTSGLASASECDGWLPLGSGGEINLPLPEGASMASLRASALHRKERRHFITQHPRVRRACANASRPPK